MRIFRYILREVLIKGFTGLSATLTFPILLGQRSSRGGNVSTQFYVVPRLRINAVMCTCLYDVFRGNFSFLLIILQLRRFITTNRISWVIANITCSSVCRLPHEGLLSDRYCRCVLLLSRCLCLAVPVSEVKYCLGVTRKCSNDTNERSHTS